MKKKIIIKIKKSLFPEHLTDLRKSGLSDETIRAAGLHSIGKERMQDLLGFKPYEAESGLVIPYPHTDFFRIKLFPIQKTSKGKEIKYMQPKASGVRLYVSTIIKGLQDVETPLYITEGEKKSLAACQAGICCVGLGGIWNWKDKDGLIADIANIPIKSRRVIIVPDSDVAYKAPVLEAVRELYCELRQRNAKPEVIQLP